MKVRDVIVLWIREVDKAVKLYVNSIFSKITNLEGEIVNIPVRMYQPQIDTNEEVIPLVTIYNYDDPSFNKSFTDVNSFDTNIQGETITVSDKPQKYDFNYQLDFYTKDPNLMNTLTFLWITQSNLKFVLDIEDSLGNVTESLVVKQTKGVRSDYVNREKEIVYRRIYNFKVTVGINTTQPKVTGYITDNNVNVHPK